MYDRLFRPLRLAAIAALLLLTGCGPSIDDTPPLPARTQQAMTLLPDGTRFAGMIDLQDLQQHGGLSFSSDRGVTIRFLDSDVTFNPLSPPQQKRLQAFIDATGFEPGADLHAAYVAGNSTQPQVILLAAAYDRARLIRHLTTQYGGRLDTTRHRGAPILRLRTPSEGAPLQLALLDDTWMAVSADTGVLRTIIDRAQEGAPAAPTAPITPLVERIGGRGGAWLTLHDLPSQRLARAATDGRLTQLAGAVRDAASALQFTPDGVHGTVLLTTNQAASDLADVVRGALSATRLRDDLSPAFRSLLDQITVTPAEDRVWITFALPQDTLARVLIQSMRSTSPPTLTASR